MEKSKALLNTIVGNLVQSPFSITASSDDMGVLLIVDVDPKELGKLIGRQGQMANAMRTIIRAVGLSENARVSIKFNDPNKSNGNKRDGAQFN